VKRRQVREEQAAVLVVDALTSGELRDLRLAIEAMLPSAKPFQVERSAIKYVQSTLRLVGDSLVRHGIQDDQLALPLHDLDQASGRVKIDGKLHYIAPLLHRAPATRLLTVDFRGNEGKVSRVSLNPLYERAFISVLAQIAESTAAGHSAASNADVNHEVAVNLDAARSFMRKTRATLMTQADLKSEYARTLLRNLLIAQKLLERVADAATSPCLKESWSQSDSGRMYGKDLSLQRVPAQVREAFIGRCHKYDFMASSYALLAGLAKSYQPSLQTGDIEHYVKNRASIREHVAKQVGISTDKVKAIFTALGFGAELADNRHKAIRRMLSAEQYSSLLANEHFCKLHDRMDEVREIIVRHFDASQPFLGFIYSEDVSGTGKKRSKNQMLAWIYQRMESEALYRFVMLAREFKQEPILTAHDCVYFKAPLPADVQADVAVLLRKDFPLLRFAHESVIPIHADDDTATWTVEGNPLVPSRNLARRQELVVAAYEGQLPLDAYLDQLTHEINPGFGHDTALGKSIRL
jgi:hypothetical protein